MKIKNKTHDDGMLISKWVSNILKNTDKNIEEIYFELTTFNGKTLNNQSPHKIKFKLKRK